MSNIGILELYSHQNVLSNICRIADESDHDLIIYTTKDIYKSLGQNDELDIKEFEVHTANTNGYGFSVSKFVRRSGVDLDLLLINSVFTDVFGLAQYSLLDLSCPVALRIYDARTWLGGVSIRKSMRGNLNSLIRKPVLSNVDYIIVEYEPIRQYILKEYNLPESKVFCFQPVVYDKKKPTKESLNRQVSDYQVKFTIPGKIESERRDYNTVIELMEILDPGIKQNIKLTLLGRPTGEYGKNVIKKLNNARVDLEYYDGWISINKFQNEVESSSVLLCPLSRSFQSKGVKEIYGKTKGSGCVWDAIQNPTPLILPDHFNCSDKIRSSVVTYSNIKELKSIITTIVNDQNYRNKLKYESVHNSFEFRMEKQTKRFNNMVEYMQNDLE